MNEWVWDILYRIEIVLYVSSDCICVLSDALDCFLKRLLTKVFGCRPGRLEKYLLCTRRDIGP